MHKVIDAFSNFRKGFEWSGSIVLATLLSILCSVIVISLHGMNPWLCLESSFLEVSCQTNILCWGCQALWNSDHADLGERSRFLRSGEKRKSAQTDMWWCFDPKMPFSIQIHSDKVLRRFCFHSNQYRKNINSAMFKVIMKWNCCSPASSKCIINGLTFVLTAQVQSWQDSTVISKLPQANTWLKWD